MENQPPTIGFEDGTIDVERLLVEPQDGHASVDSVICFNEKNAMEIQEVSCSFGATNTGIAHKRRDIFNGDAYSLHSEVEGGYFRLHNDFCSMGEEYLLGVEFAESIANPNYVSSECLQTSVSDHSILASGSRNVSPWKTDLFKIMEVPYCHSEEHNIKSSDFDDIGSPCHDSEILIEEKPVKLRDISTFHDISSCSFQDTPSDENTSIQQSVQMLCSPEYEKNDESGTSQNGQTNGFQEKDSLVTLLSRARHSDAFPTQKRSRKPTQRYIVEVEDLVPRQSKRKREILSTTFKDKSLLVKDRKKCHMGYREMIVPAEESSVKAIQVPFASLVHKECPRSPAYDTVHSSDRGNVTTKPRNSRVTPESQKKKDEGIPAVHLTRRSDSITTQTRKSEDFTGAHLKKSDDLSITIHLINSNDNFTAASHKKKDENVMRARLKRRNDRLTALSQKRRDEYVYRASPKKKGGRLRLVRQKKRDNYDYDYAPAESPEEVNGRRKHHRLWTISEVNSLIEGVSEHGVGRWSRIKKVFFSSSAHRTSVDLKDKWRNLLKASGMQGECNNEGEKKRNVAWRPLPNSILRRVCELANMYPYPKGGNAKIGCDHHHHHHRVSPDRSTDITLSDYRRILRSINDN